MNKFFQRPSRLLSRARRLLVILTLALLSVSAASAQSANVTLNVNGAPLESVLKQIEQQTNYRFFYSRDVIDTKAKVTLQTTNTPLTETLDKLFANRGISYVIDKKQIVLNRAAAPQSATNAKNLVAVKGNVKDSSGEPLIGVTITNDKIAGGTTTDIDGNYEINVPAGSTLHYSFVGCSPEAKKVTGAGRIDVTLNNDNNTLDEVVVVGYGVQKKKLVTGSTLNIKGDEILKQNTTNAMGALYSSVPGVNIIQNNGQPDAGFKVNIRGIGTTGDSSPLYVIDGIAGGNLNSLNPADIESIDILKDAASCAIYGSRAANGVILVTPARAAKAKCASAMTVTTPSSAPTSMA